MPQNILPKGWHDIDSHELRLLLKERIGGPGQYDSEQSGTATIHIPSAREECRLSLTYQDGQITAIHAGLAFNKSEWKKIVAEVETSFRTGADFPERAIAFSSFRVTGAWASQRSSVRILPLPESAPDSEMEIAEHPFVLEYTYKRIASSAVSRYRAMKALQQITLLLDVLLIGRTCLQPALSSSLWTMRWEKDTPHFEWSKQGYFAPLADYPPTSSVLKSRTALAEIQDSEYYGVIGHDGAGLRVPESLDDSLARFSALDTEPRAKMARALYWFDVAQRVYSMSSSASFAALVSSIEALTDRGAMQIVDCPKCGQRMTHETPGATKLFQDIVERFAPGASTKKTRSLIYELRSSVLHGSALMQTDELKSVGWDPPEWTEYTMHAQLGSLPRVFYEGGCGRLARRGRLKSTLKCTD